MNKPNHKLRKTHEQFVEELKDRHGAVFVLHEKYQTGDIKILVEHECGYKWRVRPANLLRGNGSCPRCSGKVRKTPEEFAEDIHKKTNGEFTVLGEFKSIKHFALVRHNVCGYEWDIAYYNLERKRACPQCSDRVRYTKEVFEKAVLFKYGDEYEVLGDCVNNRSQVEVLHVKCGETFTISPTQLINQNMGCPFCNDGKISKGESRIRTYLENDKINFTREVTFKDCKYERLLPFDFGILDENKKIKMLIEFDGEQHYRPVEFWGGEKQFELQKLRDEIKTQYCKDSDIPLLRIPYWDFDNIEDILAKELKGVA